MTEQALIAVGYRRFDSNGPWIHADYFYQKRVRDGDFTLYFINVGMWDNRRFGLVAGIGWEAQAHFYRGEDRSFKLEVPVRESDTVESIEAVFREFYDRMGCVPDIHNQD